MSATIKGLRPLTQEPGVTGAKFLSLSFKPTPQEAARGGHQRFNQRVEELGTPLDDREW